MIFKEQLNNILRHAEAKNVVMKAYLSENNFTIELIDDGKGYEPGTGSGGQGIKNTNARAKRIGAIFDINGQRGKGTVVTLTAKLAPGNNK